VEYELTRTIFEYKAKYLKSAQESIDYMEANGYDAVQREIIIIKYQKWEQYLCNLAFSFSFDMDSKLNKYLLSSISKDNKRIAESYNEIITDKYGKFGKKWIELHGFLWQYLIANIETQLDENLETAYKNISTTLIEVMKSTVLELEELKRVMSGKKIEIQPTLIDCKYKDFFGVSLTEDKEKFYEGVKCEISLRD
jgi:hypothetical protein